MEYIKLLSQLRFKCLNPLPTPKSNNSPVIKLLLAHKAVIQPTQQ